MREIPLIISAYRTDVYGTNFRVEYQSRIPEYGM